MPTTASALGILLFNYAAAMIFCAGQLCSRVAIANIAAPRAEVAPRFALLGRPRFGDHSTNRGAKFRL
jgi:hypothetical protein